ncbi:MAG: YesL family protein [Agathobacter sp.]
MNFGNLFNLDNPIWKYLGRVWDALCLTALFVIFSIPIITMGAAATATSYVAQKIMKDEEGHILNQFVSSFKANLKQSIGTWLICLIVAVILGFNFWFYYHMDHDFARVMMIVVLVIGYIFLMIVHFLFPVIARFENPWKNQFALAFFLAMKNFGWTLLMITTTLVITVVSIFITQFLVVFSIGLAALIDAWICNMIFDKYIKEHGLEE